MKERWGTGPPVARYPKPWAYRNPYVVRRRGPGSRRLPKPLSGSAAQVRELAATGEYETMRAIGAVVGVSRERVRQIIRQHDIPWQDYAVRLRWECPGCGAEIAVNRSEWEARWGHMPAHCRSCSQEDQNQFCKRGHLRSEESDAQGACRACHRLKSKCVVEIRTCEVCQQPLPITDGMRRQALYGRAVNKYHQRCWGQKLAASRGERTHCRRGHELTEENTYRWRGTRACRACIRRRTREYYQRSRAKQG